MKKRGISLIVLIVTIIVIIILAAVVILTLSKNNPIGSAKEATFKEDIRTFQDELAMYIAKDYTSKGGQRDNKINANKYVVDSELADYEKSVYKYIPSFSKKYEGKFIIINDELAYNEDNVTEKEKEWCDSLSIRTNAKTGAEKAASDPETFYGATVDYKTGNRTIDDDITEWKIFYSDEKNIYLISSKYVDPNNLPFKDNLRPVSSDATRYPKGAKFSDDLVKKYSGSSSIAEDKMKFFNFDFFNKNYSSSKSNIKGVAYMLDYEIWSDFVNPSLAEYAVGGPSVELLLKSYSKKYNKNFSAEAINEQGYQVENSDAVNNEILATHDNLYILDINANSEDYATGMWLASPTFGYDEHIMCFAHGTIGSINFRIGQTGFRPIVCLQSNVILKDGTNGYDYNLKM